jgi:hypothetical protein
MDNVGIVVIKEGDISAEELEKSFNDMWKVNWFWQIRQVGPKKFLVRFPLRKRIKELVEYPSINLKKEGVVIYFENWEGEAEPFEEFQEIWVKIFGIPAKWLTWKTICQVSTALGVLVNIDWQVIFRSFYKEVRVKVAVRDKSKIPSNRLFEMEQCFFLINFLVESDGETIEVDGDDDEDPGQSNDGDKVNDDAEHGDDFKALDKSNAGENSSKMETDPSYSGGRSGPRSTSQMAMESSVQAKVFGKEPLITTESALVIRSAEENIGKNLLQHFEEEEDDDGEGTKSAEEGELPKTCVPSMLTNVWKEKKQWGPVQATRMSSRIPRDGKSAIEKAQDLKKGKNLEIPKGNIHGFSNSFAALDNHTLSNNARHAGISLGHKTRNTDDVIDQIKKVELNRLDDFHQTNPASFLPKDISLSIEELKVGMDDKDVGSSDQDDYTSDVPDDDEPWTLVHSRKKGRRKLIFKNGSSSNMEL